MEVIDSVQEYVDYMKEIFDFAAIKNLLHGANGPPLKILINAMHGGKNTLIFFIRYKLRMMKLEKLIKRLQEKL